MARDVGGIAGGYDTARVSAVEADRIHRAERDAAALRYFDRHGIEDLPIILGLRPELCAAGCGEPATKMGYCNALSCAAARRAEAKRVGDGAYRRARGDLRC